MKKKTDISNAWPFQIMGRILFSKTHKMKNGSYLSKSDSPSEKAVCWICSPGIPAPVLIQSSRCVNTSRNLLEGGFEGHISTGDHLPRYNNPQ